MFNKIKELIFPFSDDPKKFVLRNVPTWFSDEFRHIEYSGNGGKSFRRVMQSKMPSSTYGSCILKYDWTYECLIFSAERSTFSEFKNKFPTLKSIQEWNDKEWKRFEEGREEVKRLRKEYLDRIKRNIE
jgi:hypothetical protein